MKFPHGVREFQGKAAHTLPRIESMLDEHAPPFILKVYRPSPAPLAHGAMVAGRVEVWFPKA